MKSTLTCLPPTCSVVFHDPKDKEYILKNSPWSFRGLHSNEGWPPHLAHDEVDFSTTEFWAQVYNLPPDRISPRNTENISNFPGTFKEWDVST